jgi:hypothetical protein
MAGWTWAFWAAGGTVAMTGLLLCGWALLRDRSRGRRRCPRCWYDMSGVPGMKCPECGRTPRTEKRFFRTRRRWRWAVAGTALATFGAGTAAAPAIASGEWVLYVPPTLLNLGLSFFDKEAQAVYATRVAGSRTTSRPWSVVGPTTQWQRLLLARRCGQLLSDHETMIAIPSTHLGEFSRPISEEALFALADLGKEARVAAPALMRACREDVESVIWELDRLHPSVGVPVLRYVILEHPEATARIEALRKGAAWAEASESPGMARAIVRAASDRDTAVREQAVSVLSLAGPGRPSCVRALERALHDKAEPVRLRAVEGLSAMSMGVDQYEASSVALAARRAPLQVRWSPPPELRVRLAALLASSLMDESPLVRRLAAASLGLIGAVAVPQCEAMARAFERESDDQTRLALALSIERLQGTMSALPLFAKLLDAPDAQVAKAAASRVREAAATGPDAIKSAVEKVIGEGHLGKVIQESEAR